MKLAKTLVCIAFMLIITLIPFSVCAANTPIYAVRLSASVDGSTPAASKFEFSVKAFVVDDAEGEADEPVSTEKLTLDTSTATYVDYTFKDISGAYRYDFTLTSCSNNLVLPDSKVVSAYVNAEEIRIADSSGENTYEVSKLSAPISISFKNSTAKAVKIESVKDKIITKVYDGKPEVAVTDDCYKLVGIKEGEDVKLAYTSAVFNSADVKTASKVTISGLSLSGNDASKYKLTTEKFDCTGKITPRPITVTADALVMTEGMPEPELTYTLSEPIVEGNSVVGSLARTSGSTAGTYVVTRGTLSFGDNYEVTFVDGSLTISSYTQVEIVDESTKIKIIGYFDPRATVSIRNLILTDDAYKVLQEASGKNNNVIAAYDMVFSSNKHDGGITVSFPVPSHYEGKEIYIYQLMPTGAVTSYKTAAMSGVVSLQTSDITQFMITAEKTGKDAGETSVWMIILKVILIILGIILGVALLVAMFFFGMIFFNKTEELKKIIKAIKRVFKK